MNHGLARLMVRRDGDLSSVFDQYSHVPLQLHRPLYLDGANYPTVYLKTPSSGLLGGDVHEIDVHVGADSQLEIRTQAATLAYPGRSSLSIDIKIASGGKLTFLPHALILGAGADITQRVKIELEDKASVEFSDTWCAGRIAMREVWQFNRFDYSLEILRSGNLVYRERFILTPQTKPLSHPVICGDYTHFSTFYVFGPLADRDKANPASLDAAWEKSQVWSLGRDGDLLARRCARVLEI